MIRRTISFAIIVFGLIYIHENNLYNIQGIIRDYKKEIIIPVDNEYKKEMALYYVQDTDKFIPDNKQELLNIYYTIINSGWEEFTFYCAPKYEECIEDVQKISANNYMLSHLNSFVHPYNTYSNLYTTYYNNGKVTVEVFRNYDTDKIAKIETRMNEILEEVTNPINDVNTKIKEFHDYIISNSKYDILKIDNISDESYHSNTAYGPLFEGYAVCSGYADTVGIFLSKLNVPNIKVATNKHVWNLAFIDNEWLHIDLTWDNPVTDTGEKMLLHTFFLINTEELQKHETDDHRFNTDIYKEAR